MAQLAAQKRGDRPASLPGQAPEQPERPQEPPRVAVATMDGGMVAQEREAMRELAKRQWLEQFRPKPQPDTPGLEREHDGDRPRTRGR